jgi:catechol 2,3-dioxygenase-like lactoylglutathione lyase family enzyme
VNLIVIKTLHHVSINVTDLERARHFYSVVLGLPELPRPPFDFAGIWYQLGDRQLHLIVHPPARSLRGTTLIDGRDGHFALRVTDYDAVLAQLRGHGVPVVERRENATPWAQIYVTDPDGNVIELNVERDGAAGGA